MSSEVVVTTLHLATGTISTASSGNLTYPENPPELRLEGNQLVATCDIVYASGHRTINYNFKMGDVLRAMADAIERGVLL